MKFVKSLLIVLLIVALIAFLSLYVFFFFRKINSLKDDVSNYPNKNNNFISIEAKYTGKRYIIFNEERPMCLFGDTCTWDDTPAKYVIYNAGDTFPDFSQFKPMRTNSIELVGGQILVLAVIIDKTGDTKWTNGGVEISSGFIVSKTKLAPKGRAATRVEYNYNAESLIFEISMVDAVSMDICAEYQDVKTICSLPACPKQFISNDGSCLAPKWQHNREPAIEWRYSCDDANHKTPNKIEDCKKFWKNDPTAIAWKKHVRNTSCQSRSWKYDYSDIITAPFVKGGILKIVINDAI